MPTYQFVKTLFTHDKTTQIDKDHLMVISPDEGAMTKIKVDGLTGTNMTWTEDGEPEKDPKACLLYTSRCV